MKIQLHNKMKDDINRCEEAQKQAKGSLELYEELVSYYSNYDSNFSKKIKKRNVYIVSKDLDYRPELNSIKAILSYFIENDPVEYIILNEKVKVEQTIIKARLILDDVYNDIQTIRNYYTEIIAYFSNLIDNLGEGCYGYYKEQKLFDPDIPEETIKHNLKMIVAKAENYYNKNFNNLSKLEIDEKSKIELIFENFDEASEKLKNRRKNKTDYIINDEYDIQDLMHSYLSILFDDVRTEEWTPSYAGGCVRQDFILKKEKIVIETKMTRDTMNDKILGEELIIDVEKYDAHSDCDNIKFFIYDKKHIIKNPKAIKNDLESKHSNVEVCFIR